MWAIGSGGGQGTLSILFHLKGVLVAYGYLGLLLLF